MTKNRYDVNIKFIVPNQKNKLMKIIWRYIENFFTQRMKLENYYIKVNGSWNRYTLTELRDRKFAPGEKIEQVFGPDVTRPYLHCENSECQSIINFRGSELYYGRDPKDRIDDYECSCCGTVQHFKTISGKPVSCNERGWHLKIAA